MKPFIYFIVSLFITSSSALCQENKSKKNYRYKTVISFSLPVKLKLEQPVSDRLTCGGILQIFTPEIQPGIKIHPFIRYYPDGVFKNFYLQARGGIGYHIIHMAYFRDLSQTWGQNNIGYASTYFGEEQLTFKRIVLGGGVDAGVQFFLNSKKTAMIDLSIGFNFYPFPSNIPSSIIKGNNVLYASEYYYYDNGLDRIPKKIGKGKWESYNGAGINIYHCLSLGFMF